MSAFGVTSKFNSWAKYTPCLQCPREDTALGNPTMVQLLLMGSLQAGTFPGHWPHLSLALGQAWNLTGFALSLLLAFRTNHSYDRSASLIHLEQTVSLVGSSRRLVCMYLG
jgi:hypothetical protein